MAQKAPQRVRAEPRGRQNSVRPPQRSAPTGPTLVSTAPPVVSTQKPVQVAQRVYALGVASGLQPDRATELVAAAAAESQLDPFATNRKSGAAGLFQLLSSGYRKKAQELGGLYDVDANTLAILPDYVSYWRTHPTAALGEAGAAVERSGEPPSFYAAPWETVRGLLASTATVASAASSRLIDPVTGVHPSVAPHDTSGLAGYPALDFLAPAGTTVLAPEPLRFERYSGHDPSLPPAAQGGPWGLSEYFRGLTTGADYYITHLSAVGAFTPGQTVAQGATVGTIGDYPGATPSHAHIGVSGFSPTLLAAAPDVTLVPRDPSSGLPLVPPGTPTPLPQTPFYPTDPSTGLPLIPQVPGFPTTPQQPAQPIDPEQQKDAALGLTGTFRQLLVRTLEIGAGLALIFIGLMALGRWITGGGGLGFNPARMLR